MSKFMRALGVSVLAASVTFGAAACGSPSGTAGGASNAAEAPAPQPRKVEHEPAEVSDTLNGFFNTVQKEAKGYMAEMMENPRPEDSTPEEDAALLKASFPKSYEFLDMSEKESAGLVGIFALVGMFAKEDGVASVSEEAVDLNGNRASIKGGDIKIRGMEGSGEGSDAGKLSKINFEHDGTEWKITGLELKK